MSMMQRRKGRGFEQRVARMFREHWPEAMVIRASQAERAHNSDVFVEVGPDVLRRLWLELQDAREPSPIAKLQQAERDIAASAYPHRLPCVIWHKLGARDIHVTTRAWVFDAIRGQLTYVTHTPITMTLDDFVAVLAEATKRKEAA